MSFKTRSLTPNTIDIVRHKHTEEPFSGKFHAPSFSGTGTYLCKQCGLALFRSVSQFDAGCGWPSFDEEIPHTVKRIPDPDQIRTEIVCARCQAHLGHVFDEEGYTDKDVRHCVNSLSLDFVSDDTVTDTQEAIYAAGCFWGVEYYFKKLKGVLKTEVGYIGGHKKDPTYDDVCSKTTGHYEAVRVIFDTSILDYESLTKYFFEIHDMTQSDGQGPDIGPQYLSAIFYYNDEQKKIAKSIVEELEEMKLTVATEILPVNTFWPAEDYHQNYYETKQQEPYCHTYTKIFL